MAAPLTAYRQIPAEPLARKVVIDTINYLPGRDGHIAELDDQSTTTSELLQAHLSASHVVKAFNAMYFEHLATRARPHGATGRSALPIAGDDQTAKQTVTAFLDTIRLRHLRHSPLSEGWRFQAGAIAYAYSTDGSFDHPRPVGAERLSSLLSQAKRSKGWASGRARRGGSRRSDTARQRLSPGLVLAGCTRPISVMMIWNAPASAITPCDAAVSWQVSGRSRTVPTSRERQGTRFGGVCTCVQDYPVRP
jgi:hypothetical protein